MPALRMRNLNDLLARAEENVTQTQQNAAIAVRTLRDIKAEIARERGRRSHLRGLALIPASLGGAVLAVRWLAAHRVVVAGAAGGVVTGAVAGIVTLAAITGPGVTDPDIAPAPTYGALPPAGRTPQPAGPPKSGPPASPAPSRSEPTTAPPPGGDPSGPPSTPPDTPPVTTPPPIDPGPPETTTQWCRIYLPRLRICLLRLPLSPRS